MGREAARWKGGVPVSIPELTGRLVLPGDHLDAQAMLFVENKGDDNARHSD
jgi:hypothetical protein